MKKFNQVINIEVSVDSIAAKLLSTMNPEEKHRELITETIIGNLLQGNSIAISQLYNSLNGYTNDIDFQVGEEVVCTSEIYDYTIDETDNVSSTKRPIGSAKIVDINIYSTRKLKLEFEKMNSKGKIIQDTEWVCHTKCSKVAVSSPKVVGKIDLSAH